MKSDNRAVRPANKGALRLFACLAAIIVLSALALAATLGGDEAEASGSTPVEVHGTLSVRGTDLVDSHGQPFQLHGMSTHGIAWFPQYVDREGFRTLRDDWNANVVRLAMYTAEYNGYCTGGDKTWLKGLVSTGVDYATELGMYAIVDWHVMNEDANPLRHKEEAKSFFAEMSSKYSGHQNVLYEICNEPTGGTSWGDIKSYAGEVIPVIRANDPDAVVIVGTPEWSQRIDLAAADRLPFDNVMYSLHFYANTHTQWLRDRVVSANASGLPLFFSEFGICDASGSGGINYDEAERWMELADRLNISYCKWSLCNKDETASAIASWCNKTGGWYEGELTETGRWIRSQLRGEPWEGPGQPAAPAEPRPPEGVEADPANGVFYDTVGHWVESEGVIREVVGRGLMTGYRNSADEFTGWFGPDKPITREQCATVLWRMSGSPSYPDENATPCSDISVEAFSIQALNWAYDKGVMTGYASGGERVMRQSNPVTRQELAKMVYATAEGLGCDMSDPEPWHLWEGHPDAWKIDQSWGWAPMSWCYNNGILSGDLQTGNVRPGDSATHAEAAKIFLRTSDKTR